MKVASNVGKKEKKAVVGLQGSCLEKPQQKTKDFGQLVRSCALKYTQNPYSGLVISCIAVYITHCQEF